MGMKKCVECGQKVAVARRMCDCGHVFIKVKRCLKCGHDVRITKKTCDCKHGFQEMPIVLTPDRLRPTCPITMKRPLYNDGDYIYNVSMAALPKQRRCNASMFANNGRHSKLGFYEEDELYDKALNDAALESIANSIISNSKANRKNKIEKLYPKRERNKSTSTYYSSTTSSKRTDMLQNKYKIKKELKDDKRVIMCQTAENVKRNGGGVVDNSNNHSSNVKRTKLQNGTIPIENGLTNLIRGEVSRAIKNKVSNNDVHATSPIPACNDELTVKHVNKEENTSYDNEHETDNESTKSHDKSDTNSSIECKCEDTSESYVKGKEKSSNIFEVKETDSSGKGNCVAQEGTEDTDMLEDEKTLKEIKQDKNEMLTSSKPVKKKGVGAHIQPINPKRPVGRPRKYPHDPGRDRRKQGKSIIINIEDIVELNEGCDVKNETDSESNKSPLKTPKNKVNDSPALTSSKPVKRKGVGAHIQPINPKRPVGRPRKYPHDPGRDRRKLGKGVSTNIEDIVELNEGCDVKNETDSESNKSPLKTLKEKVNNPSTLIPKKVNNNSPMLDKKEIKRGRPKGCKDSKPRKSKHDYIKRITGPTDKEVRGTKKKASKSKCLSPPLLIQSTKKENYVDNEVPDAAEIERIEKRLDETDPFIIPDSKKELYSAILDEINRRISSQSFQPALLLEEI